MVSSPRTLTPEGRTRTAVIMRSSRPISMPIPVPIASHFLKSVGGHWMVAALSYQRRIWNGGFHSGPRNFTTADTVRRKSENCPLAMRKRAVARKVTTGLGTIDKRPMPGPPLENGASWPMLLSGVSAGD